MSPLKINEAGFVVISKESRTVFTKWEVINWNDIYSIKPITIIFCSYIRLICKGRIKPIWIPLSVWKKSDLVEDIIRYVPDENPLKVFITTGKITQVARTVQGDSVINNDKIGTQANNEFEREILKAEHALKTGANWFYWIAGLSLINTVIIVSGNNWSFLAGLNILQVADVFVREIIKNTTPNFSTILMFFSVMFDMLVVGVMVVFGYFANKRHNWSFVIGMVLYALDMLISLAFKDFLSFAIHVIALLGIYNGLNANFKLNEIERRI